MPIYEFKCMKCNDVFELLLINANDSVKLQCPTCHAENIERVLSAARITMGSGGMRRKDALSQTRTCPGGSCTTYDIPGPKQ